MPDDDGGRLEVVAAEGILASQCHCLENLVKDGQRLCQGQPLVFIQKLPQGPAGDRCHGVGDLTVRGQQSALLYAEILPKSGHHYRRSRHPAQPRHSSSPLRGQEEGRSVASPCVPVEKAVGRQ